MPFGIFVSFFEFVGSMAGISRVGSSSKLSTTVITRPFGHPIGQPTPLAPFMRPAGEDEHVGEHFAAAGDDFGGDEGGVVLDGDVFDGGATVVDQAAVALAHHPAEARQGAGL